MSHVTLSGAEVDINGSFLKLENLAPNFILVDRELNTVTLESFKDRKKVLAILPSIDTPVCSKETMTLNKLAEAHPNVVVLVISKDLPFAHDRFCKSEGVENIVLLSDVRPNSCFAKDFGVQIGSGPLEGLLARAVVVLNEQDRVIYSNLSQEITEMPNLEEAFQALDDLDS